MTTGLYLPGSSGEYVSTPDASDINTALGSAFSLVVDVDILTSWTTPVGSRYFMVKYLNAGTDKQFTFNLNNSSGSINFSYSANGTTWPTEAINSGADTGFAEGTRAEIGVTVDWPTIKFWAKANGAGSWSQVGTDKTAASTAWTSGTNELELGSYGSGASGVNEMVFYSAKMYSGVGANTAPGQGTLVAEFDASLPVEPRSRDSLGNIWTINGSAYAWEGV